MLTSTAITDNIVVNPSAGISASIGPRDFCGIAVLSQGGATFYGESHRGRL